MLSGRSLLTFGEAFMSEESNICSYCHESFKYYLYMYVLKFNFFCFKSFLSTEECVI